jgi:hypothetical protein
MERAGIARMSNSPWSSPLQIVPKNDGTSRYCGDYRGLNSRTVPDKYPIPHILVFAHNLAGCKAFSKISLIKAYNQIPVNPEDIPKTAVITPFGLFEFPYMSFGRCNAGQTLQRFIDEMIRDFDFVFARSDDFLVSSTSSEEHEHHLRILFSRFQKYGLAINSQNAFLVLQSWTSLGSILVLADSHQQKRRLAPSRSTLGQTLSDKLAYSLVCSISISVF